MKVYRLILLAIASIAMAAEVEGEQLTTLATVEVEVPTPIVEAAADTAATTDAPDATDTVEAESSEFVEDDTEAENDVGIAVGGEEVGLNISTEADLPAEFQGNVDIDALLEEEDPPEEKSSLEARWGGHNHYRPHSQVQWCFGPFNIFNLRFGATCPYYSRNWGRFHRKKLHVDLRVWQRKGRWYRPWWKKLANIQVARYTHRGKECGYVRDRITNHVLFDACRWWSWPQMARKLTRVVLKHTKRIFISARWPMGIVMRVVGGTYWPLYNIIMRLKVW